MAKFDWDAISKELLIAMGGEKNIKSFQHCATRFRFYALDDKKVDKKALGKISLAKGVNKEQEQWQVIFGAGTVNKVHDNFANHVKGGVATKDNQPKKPRWDKNSSFLSNLFTNLRSGIRAFADIFIPLIPVFIVGGLALAISSLIGQFAPNASTKAASGYFDLIGGGIIGSLPAFVGYTAMKKFGGTPMLGLAIGIVMVGPSLLNGWSSAGNYVVHAFGASNDQIALLKNLYVHDHMTTLFQNWSAAGGTMDAHGNILTTATIGTGAEAIKLGAADYAAHFGSAINATPAFFPHAPKFFQFGFIGYQAQVFPTLGIIAVAYWIERFMKKISPEAIAIISVPLVTVFVSLFLGFLIVGPAGRAVGNGITEAFQFLFKWTNWPGFGLGGALLGAAYPFLVVTGLHQGFTPVEASIIAETASTFHHSFSWITPIASVSNVAQGMVGLTLAVLLWKRSPQAGSTAMTGAISANMGITEPILFGVNLPIKFGMLAASAASAIGGYWVGMTHTVANSLGSASWLGLIAQFDYTKNGAFDSYISSNGFHTTPGLNQLPPIANMAIAMGLTTFAAILLTLLFSKTFGKKSFESFVAQQNGEDEDVRLEVISNERIEIISPMKGKVSRVSSAKDSVFKSKALGDGVVIYPTEGKVVSPINGEITLVFDTEHAYGIKAKDGTEILIHIGVDSTEVNFSPKVKVGQKVKAGDELVEFDLEELTKKAKSIETLVAVVPGSESSRVFKFNRLGNKGFNDTLFALEAPKSKVKATTKRKLVKV